MEKLKYIFLYLILMPVQVFSQEISIEGKLLDEKREPVPFATIVLKGSNDSTIIKSELSNESGEFIIQQVKEGKYFIHVQSVGYTAYRSEVIEVGTTAIKLGEIRLSTRTKELKAVTVEAEKPFIEKQADKTVVNVENSIVQAGSSVMEVFEKLPGVLVDQDGNIRLRGKQGVVVYIDDKPTTLSGQDLVNMLRGMSASQIQKVEIITNPSAKYDAAGNAGILNIIMKKNKLEGYNGSAVFTYGQGRYPKFTPSLSLNYKKKKFNIYFNDSYSNRTGFNNLLIDRRYYENGSLTQKFLTNNYIILHSKTHNPRLGIDYNLSQKTTVSVLSSLFMSEFSPETENHTDIYGTTNEKQSTLNFSQETEFNSLNYELNTQVNHKFDTLGQSLLINLDYGRYENTSDQVYSTLFTDIVNDTSGIIDQSSNQLGMFYLYSIKADYSKPFSDVTSLEGGVKSSLVKSDMDMRFYNEGSDAQVFDSLRSSHFLYDENINAAYLSLRRKINDLTVQAGLRAEQTVANGLQKMNDASFDRNYFQIFPTLYLNYDFGKNNVNMNIGRRINRPGYGQMNPFRRMIDFTTYSEGNPYLLPELTYVMELSYSHDNTYFVAFNYSHTDDNITDVLIQDAATRTTIQSIVNLNQLEYYSIDLTYTKRLNDWWKTNANFTGYYSHFIGTVNNFSINQGKPTFSFHCNNNFSLTDNLSAELTIHYNHENLYGVTTMKSEMNVSCGFQQSIWNKRGMITLNMTDIFWTAWPRGFTDFGNVTEDWKSKRDTRVLNLSFTYNFGKGKAQRMRRNTGADEEKGRIG